MRASVRLFLVFVCAGLWVGGAHAPLPAAPPSKTGAELYRSACASCHGSDGRAHNLKPYDAAEPRRFVSYYGSMSAASTETLVRATATIPD